MRDGHPLFERVEPETPLWRYFDFPKFTSLLLKRALHFSRADLLGDPLEGSATRARLAEQQRLRESPPDGTTPEGLDAIFRHNADWHRQERQCVYVNCWHIGDHESVAMWKGYGGGSYGVAIKSTFRLLDQALQEKIEVCGHQTPVFIGAVRYIDHSSEVESAPGVDNLYGPFMCKSVAYRHEEEVRAVFADLPGGMSGRAAPGYLLAVELQSLIQSVTVSPLAPGWFQRHVLSMCSELGFAFPLRESIASMEPVY